MCILYDTIQHTAHLTDVIPVFLAVGEGGGLIPSLMFYFDISPVLLEFSFPNKFRTGYE